MEPFPVIAVLLIVGLALFVSWRLSRSWSLPGRDESRPSPPPCPSARSSGLAAPPAQPPQASALGTAPVQVQRTSARRKPAREAVRRRVFRAMVACPGVRPVDCAVGGNPADLMLWLSGRADWDEAGLSASGKRPELGPMMTAMLRRSAMPRSSLAATAQQASG